jgi:hypothetical protein
MEHFTSRDYKQLIIKERYSEELDNKDFENTLTHFAELYYKEKIGYKKIEFIHGFITSIAGDVKSGEICIVEIDGEELHPSDAEILAINCGYLSFKEMTLFFKEDFTGTINKKFIIKN